MRHRELVNHKCTTDRNAVNRKNARKNNTSMQRYNKKQPKLFCNIMHILYGMTKKTE